MVRLRAIGECVIEVGPARVGPEAERAFALLLVLTLMKGRPLGRHRLVDLLWPGTSEERARHNLRQALYKLRQLGAPVTTESNQLRLDPEAIVPDVLLHGELEGPPPPELLRADLPFGEFLAGYAPDFSAPFRTWVEEQRGVMHARLRRAALRLLLDERRRGNWGTVETLARKVLQLDPLNEEATLGLAEATALTGSKRAALAILDAFLAELGDRSGDIRLPASVLRRRIAERLEPAASGAPSDTCFVGRAESVAFLTEHFQRARAGDGHTVLVWGEPGIGKTRLLAEFARMALLDGAQVPRVACQERDTERPLSLFVDAVPLLQALPGALGIAPESVEHLRRLTAHDPAVLEPSAATREAELLFAGVRRAIYDLVDAVASESPLVLVCEDVHWLDAQSWRVLRELAATLPGKPVLLVLSSRLPHATAEPPARNVAGLVAHRLEPLDQGAALALFESLTAGAAAPTSFRDWCIQIADGNPLYLRALGGHWQQTRELRAPQSLKDLLRDRLGTLSPEGLRLLQAASAFATCCTLERLEAALQYPRYTLLRALTELEEKSLVGWADGGLRCKHELVSEIALGLLPSAARRTLHKCVATVLEAHLQQSRSVTLLWSTVQQWQLAGEPDRAVALLRISAVYLMDIGLPGVAADVLEEALNMADSDIARRELLVGSISALRMAGQWHRLTQRLGDYRRVQEGLDDIVTQHDDFEFLEMEAMLRTRCDLSQLLARASSCVDSRNASAEHRIRASVLGLMFADNLFDAEAAARLFACLGTIESSGLSVEAHRLHAELIYHSTFGDIDAALRCTDSWLSQERSSGDAARICRALRNAAIPYRIGGLLDKAFACLVESFDLASKHQMSSHAANTGDVLATLNLHCGDTGNAKRWCDTALAWARKTEENAVQVSIERVSARISLFEGDIETARSLLRAHPDQGGDDTVLRRSVDGLAADVLLAAAEGARETLLSTLPGLLALFEKAQCYYGQDFTASAIATGLHYLGQKAEADRLLRKYTLYSRRERAPLSAELKRALTLL